MMYRCSKCGDYMVWDNDLQAYICNLCLNINTKDEVDENCILQQL